jgi:hypothetical protein
VVHIESRVSHRTNSEYEIYVDVEADPVRVEQSMLALKRQVSCVDFDPSILSESNENRLQMDSSQTVKTSSVTNNNRCLDLPPFFEQQGQALGAQSKLRVDKRRQNLIR